MGNALHGLNGTFFHDVTQQVVSGEECKSAPCRRFDQQNTFVLLAGQTIPLPS